MNKGAKFLVLRLTAAEERQIKRGNQKFIYTNGGTLVPPYPLLLVMQASEASHICMCYFGWVQIQYFGMVELYYLFFIVQ